MTQNSEYLERLGPDAKLMWERKLKRMFKSAVRGVDSHRLLDEQVLYYLSHMPEGRTMYHNVTLYRTEQLVAELGMPKQVIVLMHPDGWVELFGPARVQPHFYTMPEDDSTAEVRVKAEVDLDAVLPRRLKEMHYPHATSKGPGMIGACQAVVTKLEGGTRERAFTWEACENPWPSEARLSSEK